MTGKRKTSTVWAHLYVESKTKQTTNKTKTDS